MTSCNKLAGIIWLFYIVQSSENNIENISNVSSSGDININNKSVVISDQLIIPNPNTTYIKKMGPKKCIAKQKGDTVTKAEINKGHVEICPKDAISIKQFNKEFFDFWSDINNNSSMTLDPVDKMTDLFLDGAIWRPPKAGEPITIGEIYDNLTTRPDFSDCTRLPRFDSVMYDGYMNLPNISTGLYSSGDEWVYKKENENNGGPLEKRLYAHDTDFSGQYPLSAFPAMKPTSWDGGY